jgi:hypothetical protein
MLILSEEVAMAVEDVTDQVGSAVNVLKDIVEDLTDEFRSKWGAELVQERDELRASQVRLENLLVRIAAEA